MSDLQASSSGRTALLVAGVHRSGTSALTGVGELLGAAIPTDLMQGTEYNAKGYFESWSVVGFHDRLLWSQGSNWDDLAPLKPMDATERAEAAQNLCEILAREYGDAPLIAIKDPRMCRFMPVMREALDLAGRRCIAVIPLRHPMEIAGSLGKRDGIGEAHAILLWLQHILPVERGTRDAPRSIIRYDALLADWRGTIARMTDETGIAWPKSPNEAAAEIDGFLSSELRHFARDDASFPETLGELGTLASEVWQAMLQLEQDSGNVAALSTLDRASERVVAATAIFGSLARKARETDYSLRQSLREEEETRRGRDAEIERLWSVVHERESTVKRLRKRTLKSRIGAPAREWKRLVRRLRGEADGTDAS